MNLSYIIISYRYMIKEHIMNPDVPMKSSKELKKSAMKRYFQTEKGRLANIEANRRYRWRKHVKERGEDPETFMNKVKYELENKINLYLYSE